MSTVEDRLRRDLPDLADAIARVAADTFESAETAERLSLVARSRPGHDGPGSRRLLAVAAAIVVVAGVAAVAAVAGFRTTDGDPAATGPPSGFGRWEAAPDAPIGPRFQPVAAWTGAEAVFWAGSNEQRSFAFTDGAAYDPATRSWRELPVPGWGHPGLTGTWFDGVLFVHAKGGASRFDPASGTTEDLPAVPGMYLSALVATTDLWAIGPTDDSPDAISVARYDGSGWEAVRTHVVPEGGGGVLAALRRLETDIVATADEVVLWSSDAGGLAYDPSADRWRYLPAPATSDGAASRAVAVAGRLVVVSGVQTIRIDVATDDGDGAGWAPVASDLPGRELSRSSISVAGDWLVVAGPDAPPIVLHTPSGGWEVATDAPIATTPAPTAVWTGTQLIFWAADAAGSATAATWTPPA